MYQFEREFSEAYGITINEATLLCCLEDGEPKPANQLCEFVGLSNSRVSRIIHSVESKGLIVREMGTVDKRQMIFTLTDAGRLKVEEMSWQEPDFSRLSLQIESLKTKE